MAFKRSFGKPSAISSLKEMSLINKRRKERNKVLYGACDEVYAQKEILYEIMKSLITIQDECFTWKRIVNHRESVYVELTGREKEGEDITDYLPLYKSNFEQDVRLKIQMTLAWSVIASRPDLFLVDCYLQSTTGSHSQAQRNEYIMNTLMQSPYFDEIWERVLKEYKDEPNYTESPVFRPERIDIYNYFSMLEKIHEEYIDSGIIPVNEYGEYVDGHNKPVILGKILFVKGCSEHGMPDENDTAEHYPHFDFSAIGGEIPIRDARELFYSYNASNDSTDPKVRKLLGLDENTGKTTGLLIMPDYLKSTGK
jgi:hypothetical protein